MRGVVRAGKKSQIVREKALRLVGSLPQKSWGAEIRALFFFVRDQIRFVRDMNGIEVLHTPDAVMELGQGDCDDKSILLASLLEAIGHPTRFVAVGFTPGEYEHVFVETKLADRWIPLDPTEPVEPGWHPPGVQAKLVIHN